MMNNSFEEIGNALKKAKKILLFPHVNMDGDALGSAAALCKALRDMGKKCYIIIEDKIPENIKFLDKGYCESNFDVIKNPDVSVCIDCGDAGRISERIQKFRQSEMTICIDHHGTTKRMCKLNYVDPKAAATGQLIYKLLASMGVKIDKEIGEAIFAAITTDTGNFQYSNTTKETHEIVAKLYDAGIDSNGVSVEIYERVPLQRLKIKNVALNTMATVCDGKGAIAYVTQEMLEETGAAMDETEGVVETLRSIDGVEISAFLKESWYDKIKVSMRAKKIGNVAEIAAKYHGGGHDKAAGFTLNCSITEAFEIVKAEIIENLDKYGK